MMHKDNAERQCDNLQKFKRFNVTTSVVTLTVICSIYRSKVATFPENYHIIRDRVTSNYIFLNTATNSVQNLNAFFILL